MTDKHEGSQALPRARAGCVGLAIRDYFAGQALAGMNACLVNTETWPEPAEMAKAAYRQADAMLKAREAKS